MEPSSGETGEPEQGGIGDSVRNKASGDIAGHLVQARDVSGVLNINTGGHPARRPSIPMQVPASPAHFTDRDAALSRSDTILGRVDATNILLCDGPPGIGKSSLARRLATKLHTRFPGGQFYVDYTDTGEVERADPDRWVTSMLRSLGVEDHYLPGTYEERVAELRTRTSDNATLVVVEGAREAAQVRPLIPRAPGSGVVVTQDGPDLTELEIDGALPVSLDPLDTESSGRLLLDLCGDRVGQAGTVVERLVAACDGLPLALVLVASRIRRQRGRGLEDLADELDDEKRRLAGLGASGRVTLSASFTLSYQRLSSPAATLYRAMAGWPGPHIDVEVAAAAVGGGPGDTRSLLEELVGAGLLEAVGSDRYRFRHSLIRLDAQERAADEELDETRAATARRAIDRYLTTLAFADRAVMGVRLRATDLDTWTSDTTDPFGGDAKAARRWLAGQAETLPAVVRGAADGDLHDRAWQAAEMATALYLNIRHVNDWADTGTAGVASARIVGDTRAVVRLGSLTSRPLTDLGRLTEAGRQLDAALDATKEVVDPLLRASVHEFHGRYLSRTDPDGAVAAYDTAWRLSHEAADVASTDEGRRNGERGAALAVYFRGRAHAAAERYDTAAADIAEALGSLLRLDDTRMAARARASLGYVHLQMGHLVEASEVLNTAVATLREMSQTYYEAEARESLADVLIALGMRGQAQEELRRVLELYDAGGSPRAGEVRERLARLTG